MNDRNATENRGASPVQRGCHPLWPGLAHGWLVSSAKLHVLILPSCGHVSPAGLLPSHPWVLQSTRPDCRESEMSLSTNSHISIFNARKPLSLNNCTGFADSLWLPFFLLHKFFNGRNCWERNRLQVKHAQQNARCRRGRRLQAFLSLDGGNHVLHAEGYPSDPSLVLTFLFFVAASRLSCDCD